MDVTNVTADAETFTANAYLVEGDDRTDLVDVGAMGGVADVVADRTDAVDAVYLTHQHGDHVQQLEEVLDRFDPAVYAFAGHPDRTDALADADEVRIGDGTFEVVHTPGHADDHVSFVGGVALFGGDVVVHDDGAFDDGSFGRTDMPGQSRETLIDSIGTLLDRLPDGVEAMYSGHGSTFHGDVRAVVERALARAERREPKYPDG